MICGCSCRISSDTARGSIHFSASRPLLVGPRLMRSMTLAALSWPSASTSTLRRKSSTPTPTDVCVSTTVENSASTPLTSSRDTPVRRVMAAPDLAALRARPCASAPARLPARPGSAGRIAARSTPVRPSSSRLSFMFAAICGLLVLADPRPHDLRDALRVLPDQRARLCELLLIGERRRRAVRLATASAACRRRFVNSGPAAPSAAWPAGTRARRAEQAAASAASAPRTRAPAR